MIGAFRRRSSAGRRAATRTSAARRATSAAATASPPGSGGGPAGAAGPTMAGPTGRAGPLRTYRSRRKIAVGRLTPTSVAISVALTPSAASSTIRASCADPARTHDERTGEVSCSRSPHRVPRSAHCSSSRNSSQDFCHAAVGTSARGAARGWPRRLEVLPSEDEDNGVSHSVSGLDLPAGGVRDEDRIRHCTAVGERDGPMVRGRSLPGKGDHAPVAARCPTTYCSTWPTLVHPARHVVVSADES